MYETICYESVDKVLTITLNRPERLNVFTTQMRDELLDAIDRADEDDGIRAIVFTGAGRVFDAEEALAGGLVRSIHDSDELLPAAYGIAREIADNTAPVSAALCRQMMWKMLTESHPMAAHRVDSAAMRHCASLPDVKEGIESFLEKRPPQFSARPSQDMPAFYPWWDTAHFGPPGKD